MAQKVGRGIFGSLRSQALAEVKRLIWENPKLRQAQDSWPIRLFRRWIVDRPLWSILAMYGTIDAFAILAEWAGYKFVPCLIPTWRTTELHGFIKEIGSFLLAGQIGILALIAVAVGLVTLIVQRPDGGSARTDTRLYYVESMAFELVTSSIALILVLLIQLFWPAQYLLHLAGYGGGSLIFKTGLMFVHLGWMILNTLIFYQFVMTTLRFVEPNAKRRMRLHYTANRVLPSDVYLRLLKALYMAAADQLMGEEEGRRGPSLTLGTGMSFDESAQTQMSANFYGLTVLADLRFFLFGAAMRSWRKRVRKSTPSEPRGAFDVERWSDRIALTMLPEDPIDGRRDWLISEGSHSLKWFEKSLIWMSVSFRRIRPEQRDLPTPDDIIEELADQVISQINRTAVTGFDTAFKDLTEFHKFVLDAQQFSGDDGEGSSYAGTGGFFQRPDQEWVREYRRIFQAAAGRIRDDSGFIRRLNNVVLILLPRDAAAAPIELLLAILELGAHEVIALESWFTRNTTVEVGEGAAAAPRLTLAGSDSRAYAIVLADFVGSWESVLQISESLFGLRAADQRGGEESWKAHRHAWPFFQAHLHHTAFFLAAAAWNEDELSTDRYRDMLLRWHEPRFGADHRAFLLQHLELMSPSLLDVSWSDAEAIVARFRRFEDGLPIPPATVFSALVRSASEDAVIVTAAVLLSWFASAQQSGDIGARTAKLLLDRQILADEGSVRINPGGEPRSLYRTAFATLLRHSVALAPDGARYRTTLDGIVQRLNQMSSRYVVPGRVFMSWGGVDGFDALYPEFFAILAAYRPKNGDDGVQALVDWLSSNEDLFSADDQSAADAALTLGNLINRLPDLAETDRFKRALEALKPGENSFAARQQLQIALTAVRDAIETRRLERLRAAEIDDTKVAELERQIVADVAGCDVSVPPFVDVPVRLTAAVTAPAQTFVVGRFDRGVFTTAVRNPLSIGDIARTSSDAMKDIIAGLTRFYFSKLAKEVINLPNDSYPDAFWRAVLENAPRVGFLPCLLVADEAIIDSVIRWAMGRMEDLPSGLAFTHEDLTRGGIGAGYVGTIRNVHIFSIEGPAESSVLVSGQKLQGVVLGAIGDRKTPVAVEVVPSPSGEECDVRLLAAIQPEWSDGPVIEIRLGRAAQLSPPISTALSTGTTPSVGGSLTPIRA